MFPRMVWCSSSRKRSQTPGRQSFVGNTKKQTAVAKSQELSAISHKMQAKTRLQNVKSFIWRDNVQNVGASNLIIFSFLRFSPTFSWLQVHELWEVWSCRAEAERVWRGLRQQQQQDPGADRGREEGGEGGAQHGTRHWNTEVDCPQDRYLHVSTGLSLIHIWRCRRSTLCRSRWSPYH